MNVSPSAAIDDPPDLSRNSWKDALQRTFQELREDRLDHWAAALTFYGVLSIFPALLVMTSLVGLFADPASVTRLLADTLAELGPGAAETAVRGPVESLSSDRGSAGITLALAAVAALWAASAYVSAFGDACNRMFEVQEGGHRQAQAAADAGHARPDRARDHDRFRTPARRAGRLRARRGTRRLGAGAGRVAAREVARHGAARGAGLPRPVPCRAERAHDRHPLVAAGGRRVRGRLDPHVGPVLALRRPPRRYDRTYGALGGVAVFLAWMWLSNIALLLGVEFSAELERGRQLAAGVPGAARRLQLEEREPAGRRSTTA